MSAKPAIYVDIDDVLCETTRELIRLADRLFGRRVVFERIASFDLAKSFSLNPSEHVRLLEIAEADDTIERYTPVTDAFRVLEAWQRSGYAVHIVTGRRPETEKATRNWLCTHAVPHDDVTFVDKYGRYGGRGSDLDSIAATDFRLAVEDCLATTEFLSERTRTHVALFARPWNASADATHSRVTRVESWDEIAARFPAP